MPEDDQQVTSEEDLNSKLTFHRTSQAISEYWTNPFTCINTRKTSSNSWPIRAIFPVHVSPAVIQPTFYVPTVRSNFRDSIMNHAQQLETSKQTPKTAADGSAQSRKRKSSEVLGQAHSESEEPLRKRFRTVKPDIAATPKHKDDTLTSEKTAKAPMSTTLSAETMSKLNAFRFSTAQSKDCPESASTKTDEIDAFMRQDDQDDEMFSAKCRYVMRDHSNRLIQSGKSEMAILQQNHPIDPYENIVSGRQNTEQDALKSQLRYKVKGFSSRLFPAGTDTTQEDQITGAQLEISNKRASDDEGGLTNAPFAQYTMKDHASRLIKSGEKEVAAPPEQVARTYPEDHHSLQGMHISSSGMDDSLGNLDDLSDSIFDDAGLDECVFDEAAPTNTTELTELDEVDDAIFEKIIADGEADWQEAQPSARVEIECFSSDSVGSPPKPRLMLPPKLPPPATPPKSVINGDSQAKPASANAPIPPFLRPPGVALVISPNMIPDLYPARRVATCFRLAEMLREISSPSPPSAIELFATVKASARNGDGTSQSFTFADLFFPQRPPYAHGIYAKCAESELFDDDSRPFLKAGQGGKVILARAIVRPKSKSGKQLLLSQENGFRAGEESSVGVEVEVLSIYVCPWEDIEYTRGIVMPEKEVQTKIEGEQVVFYKPEKRRKFNPLKPPEQSAALKAISSNLPSTPTKMAWKKE